MLLLVNKLHFRLLGFTPRRSLSSSLTLIVNSTIVTHSRFVTTTSRQTAARRGIRGWAPWSGCVVSEASGLGVGRGENVR